MQSYYILGGILVATITIAIILQIKKVRHSRNVHDSVYKENIKPISNIEVKHKNQKFSDKIKNEKKKEKVTLLFCFDFDNTITQDHTHNILINNPEVIQNGGQVNDEKFASILINKLAFKFKAENELIETFKAIYKEGHNIAILSYHSFPLVIKDLVKTLSVKAGIPIKEIVMKGEKNSGRIYINASYPSNVQEYHMKFGKNEYINDAMLKFNFDISKTEDRARVFLLDDDRHNNDLAVKIIQVIEVDPNDPNSNHHLKKAREVIYDLQLGKTLDQELDKIIT